MTHQNNWRPRYPMISKLQLRDRSLLRVDKSRRAASPKRHPLVPLLKTKKRKENVRRQPIVI
jgi:hypothetical protein